MSSASAGSSATKVNTSSVWSPGRHHQNSLRPGARATGTTTSARRLWGLATKRRPQLNLPNRDDRGLGPATSTCMDFHNSAGPCRQANSPQPSRHQYRPLAFDLPVPGVWGRTIPPSGTPHRRRPHEDRGDTLSSSGFVIGALAAVQRDYFSNAKTSCAEVSDTILTIVAGPLNYVGVQPQSGNQGASSPPGETRSPPQMDVLRTYCGPSATGEPGQVTCGPCRCAPSQSRSPFYCPANRRTIGDGPGLDPARTRSPHRRATGEDHDRQRRVQVWGTCPQHRSSFPSRTWRERPAGHGELPRPTCAPPCCNG